MSKHLCQRMDVIKDIKANWSLQQSQNRTLRKVKFVNERDGTVHASYITTGPQNDAIR